MGDTLTQASIWYRAQDDAETSIRAHPQMMCAVEGLPEALESLREQGYRVQRVVLDTLCGKCKGSGREYYLRKGMRRTTPQILRPQRECSACGGKPELSTLTVMEHREP